MGRGERRGQLKPTRTRPSTRPRALWARPKSEITEEQYDEFYKHVAHDFEAPLRMDAREGRGPPRVHACSCTSRRARRSTCGTASIGAASSSTCAACSSWTTRSSCCRRTCASCAASSTPTTCRSTSRARSCRSRGTSKRSAPAAVKRVLGCSRTSRENDKEKYATFWKEFGRVLKEGVGEDIAQPRAHREAAALRVDRTPTPRRRTSRSPTTSRRMKHGQDSDLLRHGRQLQRARKNSPHLEIFRKKGIEVLLLSRPRRRVGASAASPSSKASRWVGRQRRARSRRARGRGGEEGSRRRGRRTAATLVERIKKALGERVKEVRVTQRLTDSPACLVADEHDMSAQPRAPAEGGGPEGAGLEADPRDQSAASAGAAVEAKRSARTLRRLGSILFDQALLAEGGSSKIPAAFVKRLNQLMLELAGAGNRIWVPGKN